MATLVSMMKYHLLNELRHLIGSKTSREICIFSIKILYVQVYVSQWIVQRV